MTLSHHLLVVVVLFLWYCSTAECANPLGVFCNKDTKIASGEAAANIDKFLGELVSKVPTDGYLAAAYGSGENTVYGLGQCRGDVGKKECSSCIQDAAKQIRTRCPNQADARLWFDYCFLRYHNKDFFGEVDTGVGIFYHNINNVSDEERFNEVLGNAMDYLSAQAVIPENAGMGKGRTNFTPFVRLYALVQCTRDLSSSSCAQCLAIAVAEIPNYCNSKKGCRVLYSSCYARYELYPFFFPLGAAAPTALSDTKKIMVYP